MESKLLHRLLQIATNEVIMIRGHLKYLKICKTKFKIYYSNNLIIYKFSPKISIFLTYYEK